MSKISILIANIFIGTLFAFVLFTAVYGMTLIGTGITGQCFIGFLLTSPMLAVMWSETKKINDESILFLGGPILSGSTTLPFYAIASQEPGLHKETPYILLAFVLFYSLMQIGMYYIVKRKQKKYEQGFQWKSQMKFKRIKNFEWRHAVLLIFILGSFIWVLTLSPMPQPQSYHAFTDTRMIFGIPNFFNVSSNILFFIVGFLGIQFCMHHDFVGAKNAWLVFFAGVALVSVGSAYYHLNPNNSTLVWDRLPMTMGFMGLLIALMSEYVNTRLSNNFLLLSALLFGALTVLYWHWTDDLRFYLWVQFIPLIVIVLVIALFKSIYPGQWIILFVLVFYIFAKITEIYDAEILGITNDLISGHTLKHCLAAISCYFVLLMLKQREIRNKNYNLI